MLDGYLTLGDGQVEIRYVGGERGFAQEAFAVLSKALPAITGYFRAREPFPKIRAVLVPNRDEFDRLVRDLLRVDIEVPSNPARIAQPQRTDMVVLSPSAYEEHSVYTYDPDGFRRLLAHELVHMVEEHLAADMEALPRWWSEGLAVHLSEQWRHEEGFRKAALEGISENRIPSLRQIEAERKLAYDWGWTIVRFLESAYGRETILRIVRQCADGDVFRAVGEDPASLEKRWRGWLRGTPDLMS